MNAKKVTVLVLLILASMLTGACWLTERIGEATADLRCINADVKHFDAEASEVSPVAQGQHRRMRRGDGTTVDHSGYAHLDMQGCLLEIFRDSGLNIEGLPLESAQVCIVDFEHGTIYNRVERKMIISTDWAVITNMGTEFLVHLDLDRGLLWVVVTDGVVQVEAAGEVVYVRAAEQTWVERGRPPEPPRPATRTEVGDLFPPVDELTNDEMDDPSVLVSETVEVPDVLEMDLEQALAHIEAAGLQVGQVYEGDSDEEPGMVLDQQPGPGSGVEPGSEVHLLVAIERKIPVPDVLGLYVNLAQEEIEKAGLEVGEVSTEVLPGEGSGMWVLLQDPEAGTDASRGSPVDLVVAAPEPPVVVPNVLQLGLEQAVAHVEAAGLQVGQVNEEESDEEPGMVLNQQPGPGSGVEPGSEVHLLVAIERRIPVPDVLGLYVNLAQEEIEKAGLEVGEVSTEVLPGEGSGMWVLRQYPAAGTDVSPGSPVDLVVAAPEPPVIVPNVLGLDLEQAVAHVEAAGLQVGQVNEEESDEEPGIVLDQQPRPGSGVEPGSEVHLLVARERRIPVPDVLELYVDLAQQEIEKAGLEVGEVSTEVLPGAGRRMWVLRQYPAAGTEVSPGSPVDLVVAVTEPPVIVPNVLELDLEQAVAHIEAAGLQVGQVNEEESDEEPGMVLNQQPGPGSGVEPGSEVHLLVARERRIPVPDVLELYVDLAQEEIEKAGLEVGEVSTEVLPGKGRRMWVLRQYPAAGTEVSPGSPVDLVVAVTEPPVVVPSVLELDLEQATDVLEAAGLRVGEVTREEVTGPGGTLVVDQEPRSGAEVNRDSEVDLVLYVYSPAANYALEFDGLDDFVSIQDGGQFDFGREFTVEAWVKPLSSSGKGGYKAIVQGAFSEPPFSGGGWVMSVGRDDYTRYGLSVCVPGCDVAKSDPDRLDSGEWQHVAGVFDGSYITVYWNGRAAGFQAHSGDVSDVNYVLIGIWSESFHGLVDEVRIWEVARTPQQIYADMGRALAGNEEGLVGYWSFDEGGGQTVFDRTQFQAHGKLGASPKPDNQDPVWVVSDAPIR